MVETLVTDLITWGLQLKNNKNAKIYYVQQNAKILLILLTGSGLEKGICLRFLSIPR